MASGVFVSYRKADDPGWAGRVRDSLASHFGDEHVFFDVDSIRGGERWEDALDAALAESGTLVLVIGPRWLDCLRERQASPDTDYHLHEITTALDRGINVYPVRVHSAPMPDLDDLPEVLRTRLPAIQWMEIYDNLFGASMQRVIEDIERAMGLTAKRPPTADRSGAAAGPAPLPAATVGPWGTEADFHEIADAVAAVADGATIRIQPGRYLKQVVLTRPVAIVGEGRGEVRLDSDAVPCLLARSAGAVVRGLRITSSAPAGAVGIRVESGDLALEDVRVRAEWVPSSTGIEAVGEGTQVLIGGCEIRSVAVGIRAGDGAQPRVERTRVLEATEHALVVTGGADPKLTGCSFAGTGASTVLVADGGRGTIDDSAVGPGTTATIEITSGGDPTVRGGRGAAARSATASLTALPGNVVKRGGDAPSPDDVNRSGWTVVVRDGGLGRFSRSELAEVRLGPDAGPSFADCSVVAVRADGAGAGTFEHCEIGTVVLAEGADPTFRSNCTIAPAKGVKITVDVGPGAAGTFEDCEIVGRNVRDGSADPAVRSDGGHPVLRRCTVKNPGEGALWVTGGGSASMEDGELRCSVGGPALVVESGTATLSAQAAVRTGARVGEGGQLVLTDVELDADPVTGVVLAVAAGGRVTAERTRFTGPGLAAARKVGRWIESRSDKIKSRTGGILGSSLPVQLAEGSTHELRDCTLDGEAYP